MTLADLFHACNQAGIRLANVGGRLESRGPAIPEDVKAGAAAHKDALLALLPAPPETSAIASPADPDAAEERAAIQAEGCGQVSDEALADAIAGWDALVHEGEALLLARSAYDHLRAHGIPYDACRDALIELSNALDSGNLPAIRAEVERIRRRFTAWPADGAGNACDLASILFAPPKPEPLCRYPDQHTLAWRSVRGVRRCATCAPPASAEWVAAWKRLTPTDTRLMEKHSDMINPYDCQAKEIERPNTPGD